MEPVPAEPGLGRGLLRARRARALCGVHETQPAAEFLVCF